MIRIIIADDHAVVRKGLKQIFDETLDLVVTDEANSGNELLEKARHNDYDVVILDEINVAMDKKVVPVAEVLDLIKTKRKNVELVLTGRGAPKEIIEAADLVTEMKEIKHPYMKGVEARVGIDF